jgi:hypothetical protein
MPRLKAVTAAAPHRSGDRQRVDRLGQRIRTEAKPTRLTKQRRDRAPSAIPQATAPGYLSVADGTETVGSIVVRDADFFAFANTKLIGKFPTLREAMRAIPARRTS